MKWNGCQKAFGDGEMSQRPQIILVRLGSGFMEVVGNQDPSSRFFNERRSK